MFFSVSQCLSISINVSQCLSMSLNVSWGLKRSWSWCFSTSLKVPQYSWYYRNLLEFLWLLIVFHFLCCLMSLNLLTLIASLRPLGLVLFSGGEKLKILRMVRNAQKMIFRTYCFFSKFGQNRGGGKPNFGKVQKKSRFSKMRPSLYRNICN